MIRVYLDACALNRLFDDRRYSRIRQEAIEIVGFFGLLKAGRIEWISSEVLEAEILRNPNGVQRAEILELLRAATARIVCDERTFQRAEVLEKLGYGSFDALHLACAEQVGVDCLLTTDDRFLRQVRRGLGTSRIAVRNPVNWTKEFSL
jgi:predicted nucleic acid-binding protein